ncbi:MAG: hypothetical protein CLLPBCKN_006874 [Chroococcidiopsis cubana SAG 39.79]|uniref:Baseplate assembly protein n=1 Tax=Chroococcidiopsis cubana SAG 39.79 TaxID=388085 RepID=A0AB37UIQ6_9CYAN|nr:putative baseplate assembly protein [Chroococcidiopsis cubana]MDZ4877439.1 hypothetical protein [Chroococcidiopsis cubana SAG 39.79]PSB65837.1 putative baseplate assembly protein [Chroococcidiopsis cubana CCALA 043]RUT11224.1 putative baseplate assembly protein [Chroococcidiopsis cubana SAG 39.79]
MEEFDFLPKLPKSNLDDRTFDELLEECFRRIPLYCPEWTDRNPSDPGITLIELFAWLVHQMLLRFNQIPLRMYVRFLEILGIRLAPPTAARTNITFYLTTDLPSAYTIPTGAEVATERTETTEAIIFSTDEDLTIGKPILRHFLTAPTADDPPQAVSDRTNHWERLGASAWRGSEQSLFAEQPQPGNCFYLALGSESLLNGNVLAITFYGATGTPTGISPQAPPRRWEAWDGKRWQPVLLEESNDKTRGFSFNEAQYAGNPEQGANVVLHLPQNFPDTSFSGYSGHWLRCVLTAPQSHQPAYIHSPRVTGLAVRTIGGTIQASQSRLIREENLGTSNGKPGQIFQLFFRPILARREGEHIEVTPPGGLPQIWKEVTDFAESGFEDLHYTIDSLNGTVQFGPLIREPEALKVQMPLGDRSVASLSGETFLGDELPQNLLQHQYGAIPPRGSVITMVAYRVGGGKEGNVQAGTLRFPHPTIPYVDRVTNHHRALNGADAQSLKQAVLQVPGMLRTRDRAVTAEDFEVLTQQAGGGAIARVKCLSGTASQPAGRVSLLVVPQANTNAIERGFGLPPEQFALTSKLQQQVLNYLDERRLLGVQVQLQVPEYVGVAVEAQVALEPAYNNPKARREKLNQLQVALYRYLNPLSGGPEGTGWPFGSSVHTSEIVTLLERTVGVHYIKAVLLFALRRQGETWQRQTAPEQSINPGPFGLICSWASDRQRSSHDVRQINS